ncbi:MAG: histidinol dehydrogenase [Chthoniobacterales bacterium]|nr:histidinol dehydrogenase [Chthoniobacterales bacterium]
MRIVRPRDKNYKSVLRALDRRALADPSVEKTVRAIVAAVDKEGDAALLRLTKKFGGPKLAASQLRVPARDLSAAWRGLDAPTRRALQAAHRNIRTFALKSLRRDWSVRNAQGARTGERFDPFRRVGIYVPGGTAPLVSTALMTCTLAAAAGVKEIVAVTPAGPDGNVSPALLAALHLAGATEVYRVGGAQAVAALALGTKTIAPVEKIFGPGNSYVVEAKRQLFGRVAIDLLPGPSEVLVIADRTANPAWVAADLLAQAEHGRDSAAVLLTDSREVLAATASEVEKQARTLPRGKILRDSLKNALLILVPSMAEAVRAANDFASEHVSLQVKDPRTIAPRILTAGAIFLGGYSPVAVGDFLAGPSHELPTGGAGKSFAGLTADQFQRRTSLVELDRSALARSAPLVEAFARVEGLEAHGRSARIRLA